MDNGRWVGFGAAECSPVVSRETYTTCAFYQYTLYRGKCNKTSTSWQYELVLLADKRNLQKKMYLSKEQIGALTSPYLEIGKELLYIWRIIVSYRYWL